MHAQSRRQFVVVCQGPAACRIRPEEPLTLTYRLPEGDVAELLFSTRWMDEGLESLVPREFLAVVVLSAAGLSEAAEEGARQANMTAAVIGLATNAVVGTLEPFVVYERGPRDGRREYHQSYSVPDVGLPRGARWVRLDLVLSILAGLTASPHSARLHRAMTHYNDALANWRPGNETRALTPLWLAAETLTDVALQIELTTTGLDAQGLATSWGIDVRRMEHARHWKNDLAAEVRRRLIFQGDASTYARAKKASDGWEHGFLPFNDVRQLASESRDDTASYVRAACLRLAGVDGSVVERLTAWPLREPKQYFPYARYIKGWLVGDTDDPSARGSLFPLTHWTHRLKGFSTNEQGSHKTTFEDKITPIISHDVKLKVDRIEVFGPQADLPDE